MGKEGMKERTTNAIYKIEGEKVKLGYRPQDNEIIEVFFLRKVKAKPKVLKISV